MLADLDVEKYRQYFPADPHPFISEDFLNLNSHKCEKIVRLAIDKPKTALGLIAGIRNGVLYSPFSAPFGGFHFRNELVYSGEVDVFFNALKDFILKSGLTGIEITLPPDLYHAGFNAKSINSFIRSGYKCHLPEITGWVDLQQFSGEFNQKNSREYYRQALRNELSFELVNDLADKEMVYNLIYENRRRYDRPIYMTFADLLAVGSIWPVDFFRVNDQSGRIAASAIFYPNREDISYAVFWGDNDHGRPLRAFDFLAGNLWRYYKERGFRYVDLGISTEAGIPNEGLLRFKESHNASSSLRYKFSWHKPE